MRTKKMIAKIAMVTVAMGFCFWGCKKDGSSDKLTLKLKSVSSYSVIQGGPLTISVECNDISKLSTKTTDTIIGIKVTLVNATSGCSINPNAPKSTIISYQVPDLSGATSATSTINFNFDGSGGSAIPGLKCRPVDTTQVKIWVKSQAGIVSDTLTLPNFVVIKNP